MYVNSHLLVKSLGPTPPIMDRSCEMWKVFEEVPLFMCTQHLYFELKIKIIRTPLF